MTVPRILGIWLPLWGAFHTLAGSKSGVEEFPPYLIDHPTDLVVRWDQPATLNCRSEGNPVPTIEWYRNGEYVETSKDNPYSQRTLLHDGSLFFLRLNQRKGKSDEGVYTCVARNHLGTAMSRNASLYLAALQHDIHLHPSNVVVAVGEPITLECVPPKGHPEPTIAWKKDGLPLNFKSSHYGVAGGNLSITYALKSDSGVYTCLASNQIGERESPSSQISVFEKPVFTRKPSNIVAKFGSTVQFWCEIQGDPIPIVKWQKETGELPFGRYEVSHENTLRIHYVTMHDSGSYICTAENRVGAVSSKASLTVQDPLDTGQTDRQKEILRELMNVRVFLDNVTTLPSSSSAHLEWKVMAPSIFVEGYSAFYRLLGPPGTKWTEWNFPKATEHSTIIPALRRGHRYEFKIQPYAGKVYGQDSNVKHLRIPEEVPNAAPQSVNVTSLEDSNGTILVRWEPPPQSAHNGIIKGYKVWCLGNGTQYQSSWTVEGGSTHLEIPALETGIKYSVRVAAINGAGIGMQSDPQEFFIEAMEEERSDILSLKEILEVICHPAFIASIGCILWVILMLLAVYLCQRHAKQYRTKKHRSKGLYSYASEDTIIKHRMDMSDSPWLSNTWKSNSASKNFSSSTSVSSQLLWAESKDPIDFHKSTLSFERKSNGNLSHGILLVPDNSSMYGPLFVDLPGRDMKTFYSTPLIKHPGTKTRVPEPLGSPDTSPLPQYLHSNPANTFYDRRARNWKPAAHTPPKLTLRESWEKNCKKELQHMNSAPVIPYSMSSEKGDSAPSTKSLDFCYGEKAEYGKAMKSFSTPRILHYTASLKVIDVLPPPPPLPAAKDIQDAARLQETSNSPKLPPDFKSKQLFPDPAKTTNTAVRQKIPQPSTACTRLSNASLPMSISDDRDNVLTPEEVAEYLEFNEEGENERHQMDSASSGPRNSSSSSPGTYGYICSPLPSDLVERDPADEDEDPELDEGCSTSLQFYRKYCHTPTSSVSEYEGSLGDSLVNGWGSISEDNFTSARCSMVSSSDGSFLMDANFAQALAVAVDSFCFGMSRGEVEEADKTYADFSPPSSPLDGILSSPDLFKSLEATGKQSAVDALPVLEWNMDWMKEIEAKYPPRNDKKSPSHFIFSKQRVDGVQAGKSSVSPSICSENGDVAGSYSQPQTVCTAAHASYAFNQGPSVKDVISRKKAHV
ncbi:roundabout homolog 4 isoform X2 [Ambystoma mexicanum]|uniref:roundabout homolog 4 isoform X2 n=1 Tax=Ambystoma mexicanum TaxID=8296 RepID=UPI0037E812F1